MIKIPEELLAKIIRKALSNGGDYADIFVGHEKPMTIQLEDDKIEKLSQALIPVSASGSSSETNRHMHTAMIFQKTL